MRCASRLLTRLPDRRLRIGALTLASWILATPALAAPTPAFKSGVNSQVSAARKAAPEIGVHVVELASGETAYSYNADTRRIVASNAKLFTTAAALDRLGPGYFLETDVLVRGEVVDGALLGDLAVVGGGDPNVSGRQYWGDPFGPFREWAEVLKENGIFRIDGELLLDHGLFDDQRLHPDWPEDQLKEWYEAPVDALSFSDNCVLVRVEPDGGPGRPARIETVPPLDLFTLESSAKTTGNRREQWVKIDRKSGAESHVLTVAGRVYARTESIDKWLTVTDPPLYFGAALAAALAEEGVAHGGRIRAVERLADSDGWRRLTTHRTDLLTVLEVINKRSQNFWAESVLKLLGAELCGSGSWAGGIRAVEEFLTEIGLDTAELSLADGSGMSRNNRFTPRQLTHLLVHMFHHRWGGEFLRTLPFSGEEDLSWEKRLARAPYFGNVMAKTGYLSGVSTLSGYAKARTGKVYAFSILMNGIRGLAKAKAAQDRIVAAIIDHG